MVAPSKPTVAALPDDQRAVPGYVQASRKSGLFTVGVPICAPGIIEYAVEMLML